MQKDDLVYVGHMLDMARANQSPKCPGQSRSDFDADDNLCTARDSPYSDHR